VVPRTIEERQLPAGALAYHEPLEPWHKPHLTVMLSAHRSYCELLLQITTNFSEERRKIRVEIW